MVHMKNLHPIPQYSVSGFAAGCSCQDTPFTAASMSQISVCLVCHGLLGQAEAKRSNRHNSSSTADGSRWD